MPEKGKDWTLRAEFNELSDRSLTEQLTTIRCRGELAESEIAAISVLRNEASRLPLFFEHYKRLGVTRFFMVDNNSDDGSHEILLAEPMADVFHTTTPYKQGQMGVYWYNGLARAHCRDHWTVTADADELLVYDGMENHNLHDLGCWLDHCDFDRLYSITIDIYPSGRIGRGPRTIKEILDKDCWFDDYGYELQSKRAGLLITGGVRERLFNQGPERHPYWLSKYPFFRMTANTVIFDAHFLWPYNEEPTGPMSALLHLKLMDDLAERSAVAEAELQHVNNSNAYRILNDRLAENADMAAHNDKSCRYEGPQSLVGHRMMRAIDWTFRKKPTQMAIRSTSKRPQWREIFQKSATQWRAREDLNKISARVLVEELQPVRFRGELKLGEIGLICVLRNEVARLPLFFEHYKKLGVDRFFMIDNDSSDGSAEVLRAEPRADVFFTKASYEASYFGIYWYNAIAQAYCRGHWLLMADADELFVYDGMETYDLKAFAAWLKSKGCDRAYAPMIDLYTSGDIGERSRRVVDILAHDCWFDAKGYEIVRYPAGWILRGGPRERLFNSGPDKHPHWVSKYPFFFMEENTVLFDAHFLFPWDRKYRGPDAALLHLKMLDDFVERSVINEWENQHAVGSRAYRIINQRIAEMPVLNAMYDGSRRYAGPDSLIGEGLLLPTDWQERDSPRSSPVRSFAIPQGLARRNWHPTMPESGLVWKHRDEFNDLSHQSLTAHLETIRCRGSLAPGEIGAICILRNEAGRLPLFLEHYKKLGVSRFFMVDNNSDDATRQLLLAEPAADIFVARASFNEGNGGMYWANGLAREYCRNNWVIRPDADELLVYSGMDAHDLTSLRDWLSARGRDRLFVIMVDVYPSRGLGIEQRSIVDILERDCWFDSEGYSLERNHGGWLVTGGPRHRFLKQDGEFYKYWLSKYPFFRVTDETVVFDPHWIWPMDWRQEQPLGALLHLKLMDDFIERSIRFEREGQHASASRAYQLINQQIANMPFVSFFHANSRRYRGPQSLLRYRVIASIDWRQ